MQVSRVVSVRHASAVELSGQLDWTCPLGAITENGDRFFSDSVRARYRTSSAWRRSRPANRASLRSARMLGRSVVSFL